MLSVGAVPARTATLKVQVLVLPARSMAVTVTRLVPTAKAEPEGGFATALEKAQLSLPETTKLTTAGQLPFAVTVMSDGQIGVGGSVSFTMTLNEQVLSGVTPLVAITVTTLVPTTNE